MQAQSKIFVFWIWFPYNQTFELICVFSILMEISLKLIKHPFPHSIDLNIFSLFVDRKGWGWARSYILVNCKCQMTNIYLHLSTYELCNLTEKIHIWTSISLNVEFALSKDNIKSNSSFSLTLSLLVLMRTFHKVLNIVIWQKKNDLSTIPQSV